MVKKPEIQGKIAENKDNIKNPKLEYFWCCFCDKVYEIEEVIEIEEIIQVKGKKIKACPGCKSRLLKIRDEGLKFVVSDIK